MARDPFSECCFNLFSGHHLYWNLEPIQLKTYGGGWGVHLLEKPLSPNSFHFVGNLESSQVGLLTGHVQFLMTQREATVLNIKSMATWMPCHQKRIYTSQYFKL